MSVFPKEIESEILSNLPLSSLLRCRSVCKEWRDTIDALRSDGRFTKSAFVLLTSSLRSGYILEAEENVDGRSFRATKMAFSPPNNCCKGGPKHHVNGFLCFTSSMLALTPPRPCYSPPYIYDPATAQFIKLPNFNPPRLIWPFVATGFGFDPSTKQFKLVKLYTPNPQEEEEEQTDAQVYTIGSSSWRKLHNVPNVSCCRLSSVSLNGSTHWVTACKRILSFNLTTETFHFVEPPKFNSHSLEARYKLQILALGGCLAVCDSYAEHHVDLWILKNYNYRESWTKIVVSKTYCLTTNNNNLLFKNVVPISFLDNSKILLLYNSKILVSYDIEAETYSLVHISGIPQYTFEYPPPNHNDRREFEFIVYPYAGNSLSPLPPLPPLPRNEDSSEED